MDLRNLVGLALFGLAVPLVLIYLLKVRRERRPVASTWLWQAARRDLLARSPFKRLTPELALLLQLLALIGLTLALAGPSLRGTAALGDQVAFVVDGSASMLTPDEGGRTRLELARERLRLLVRSLPPGAQAMIVQAGAAPRVVLPLDRDPQRLEQAVDRVTAEEVAGRLGPALTLASERLRQLPGSRRIVVLTDGSPTDWAKLPPVAIPTELELIGGAADNVGIVRTVARTVRNPGTGKLEAQVFALATNRGTRPKEVFATLRQRNVVEPVASRRLVLPPGEATPIVLGFEVMAADLGSGVVVELSPGDAFGVDDRGYARIPEGNRLSVLVVPKGSSGWTRRALEADPDVEILDTDLTEVEAGNVPLDSLVVIDGTCPKRWPAADLLVLNPPPGPCGTVVVGELAEEPSITSWSDTDDRFRFLTLDGVNVPRARLLEADSPSGSLVRTRTGTLIADASSAGRTVTVVGFDPSASNWPLKASFVLFVRNVVESTRTRRARGVVGSMTTGSPLRLSVPDDVSEVTFELPDVPNRGGTKQEGRKLVEKAREGLAVLHQVSQAGFYFASWGGKRPGSLLVPVNLASAEESDLTPRKLEIAQVGNPGETLAKDDSGRSVAWIVALVGVAFLLVDLLWLTRRSRAQAVLANAGVLPRPDWSPKAERR